MLLAGVLPLAALFFRKKFLELLPILIVAIMGIMLSDALFVLVRDESHHLLLEDYKKAAQERISYIKQALNENISLLEPITAFFNASNHSITREEFRDFVHPLFYNYPNIQAINWVPYVTADQRGSYEQQASKHFPQFQITERNKQGKILPAGKQKSYFPIYFMEPYENNDPANLGFDLGSNKLIRNALVTAWKTGLKTAPPPITLFSGNEKQRETFIFAPVYHKSTYLHINDLWDRHLLGCVMVTIRLKDVLENALVYLAPKGIDILIVDVTDAPKGRILYFHNSRKATTPKQLKQQNFHQNQFNVISTINIAGRTWRITCTPSMGQYQLKTGWRAVMVLLAGLIVTALLTSYLFLLNKQKERINAIIEERSKELKFSEAKMWAIVDNTVDGIITTDSRGNIIAFNHASEMMYGYKAEEVLDKNVTMLYADVHLFRYLMQEKYIGVMQETLGLRKDGTIFPIQLGISKIILGTLGQDILYTSIIRDITEQKKTEDNLRDSEAKMRAIVDNTVDGIVIADEKGSIVTFNQAAENMFGYKRVEVLGEKLTMLSADTRQLAYYMQEKYLGAINETKGLRKNGSEFPMQMGINKIILGEDTLFTTISRDITAPKKAEKELRRHRDHLQELVDEQVIDLKKAKEKAEQTEAKAKAANYAKSEFLANMSHELRTPMHSILSFAEMGVEMLDDFSKEEQKENLELIFNSGERLLKLLNELLDLSKLEAGAIEFNITQNHLLSVVKETVEQLDSLARDKKITIEIVEPDIPTEASFDRAKITQVIWNLFSNAIKFTPEGKTISISFNQTTIDIKDNGTVPALSSTIIDQGIGIPEKELEAVFDKFIQSSKTKTGAGGTGLGLAITKEIIEGHNGKIWAKNNPEGGAAFTFIIPIK